MTVGLWCVWRGPNRFGRRWWDKPFFAAGMRDKRKFEGGIRDGKRRAWSGKLVILMEGRGNSYFFVCLFVLFCFFFFRPGNEVGNGNALDIHDYTIPWRKPSLPMVLFKPFDIKKWHPNLAILSKKNSTITTTQQTQKRLEVSRYLGQRNRPSSGHLAKKRRRKVNSLVWGSYS